MAETYTLIKDTPSITIHKVVLTSGTTSRAIHCQGARSVTIHSSGAGTLIMYPPDSNGNADTSGTAVELDNALGVSDSTAAKVGMIDRLSMPPWFGIGGNFTHYIMITWEQAGA